VVFVELSGVRSGHEALPYAGLILAGVQDVRVLIPVVEISDHTDPLGIGGPDREQGSLLPLHFHGMGPEFVI